MTLVLQCEEMRGLHSYMSLFELINLIALYTHKNLLERGHN